MRTATRRETFIPFPEGKHTWDYSFTEFRGIVRAFQAEGYEVAFETGGPDGHGVVGEEWRLLIKDALVWGDNVADAIVDEAGLTDFAKRMRPLSRVHKLRDDRLKELM